jgi:hypothetical protein
MLKKELRMIKRVAKNIYPSFESELKCLETLVNFKKGEFYKIVSFGIGRDKEKKPFQVWYMQNMSNPNIKFPVMKTTMNKMIDANKIIHYYKD